MAKISLLPHQWDFMHSEHYITMMVCGRGAGKSFVIGEKGTDLVSDGKNILVGAPTYSQLHKVVFKAIIDAFKNHGIRYKYNKTEKTITVGEVIIYGTSGEAFDGARGLTNITALIIDEAALVPKEALEVWVACLRGQGEPEIYLATTPRGLNNWVYEYSKRDDTLTIFASTKDNTKVNEGFHKSMVSIYGNTKFADQELEGKFLNFDGGYFDVSHIKTYTKGQIVTFAQAFDLGFTDKKQSDYSAWALCGMDNKGNFVVLAVERWKFEVPATRAKMTHLIDTVNETIGYVPAYVETNSAGIAVYQDLTASGVRVIGSNSSASKVARNVGLSCAMEKGTVYFKDEDWRELLKSEFQEFTWDDSHIHDDMIDAVVMCYNQLKFGNSGGIATGKNSIVG